MERKTSNRSGQGGVYTYNFRKPQLLHQHLGFLTCLMGFRGNLEGKYYFMHFFFFFFYICRILHSLSNDPIFGTLNLKCSDTTGIFGHESWMGRMGRMDVLFPLLITVILSNHAKHGHLWKRAVRVFLHFFCPYQMSILHVKYWSGNYG